MQTITSETIKSIESVEDMPQVARRIVSNYCDANGIDEADIFPNIWADIISELNVVLFRPCNKLLKLEGTQYGEYDRLKILYIYEHIYKRLSNSHCQEITLKGFCDMVGIPKQSFYNWANDDKYLYTNNGITYNISNGVNNNQELSTLRFDLHEKIMEDNEESLFNLMKDRRNNPMKLLPKLNKVHGWNMSGVSAQATRQALSDAELPRLGGGSCAEIGYNLEQDEEKSTV